MPALGGSDVSSSDREAERFYQEALRQAKAEDEAFLLAEARRNHEALKRQLLRQPVAGARSVDKSRTARAKAELVGQSPALVFPISGAVPQQTPVQELNRQSQAEAEPRDEGGLLARIRARLGL